MKEEGCGFSCTYAKKKIYEQLNGLVEFSKYDRYTAMKLFNEIQHNMNIAQKMIWEETLRRNYRA